MIEDESITCNVCDGEGTISAGRGGTIVEECWRCKGKGSIPYDRMSPRQKEGIKYMIEDEIL